MAPITALGYGAFKVGRNQKTKYGHSYELPTEQESDRLLNSVLDLGITVIDTAPSYGLSEERIGRYLSHRREEFFLSTKAGETFEGESRYDYSKDAIVASVHSSLQRLRTDVLDCVFVHSHSDDVAVLTETDAVETLLDLKAKGLTKLVGFSGYSCLSIRNCLPQVDAIMVEFNVNNTIHAGVMQEAADRGVKVFVKKGMSSGSVPAQQAIPFVLENTSVTTLLLSSLSVEHLKENIWRTSDEYKLR